jgi:hypothetical protein
MAVVFSFLVGVFCTNPALAAGQVADSTPPTDGTMTASTTSSSQILLSWTAATDTGSGLSTSNSYLVVRADGTASAPLDCTAGTRLYQGIAQYYYDNPPLPDTQYAYRVCAFDANGNVSTGATASAKTQPLAAPLVTSHLPYTGAVVEDVSTVSIKAYFNVPINPATINSTTFLVKDQAGVPLAGTLNYTSDFQVTFTPTALISGGVTYTVTITTGVQNSSGTAMAADYSWNFTINPYLGGVPNEGNLLITPMNDGRIGVYRYITGTWQQQVYSWDSKGSRLQVAGTGYSLGYFNGGTAPTSVANSQLAANHTKTEWTTLDGLRIIQELIYQPGAVYYGLTWKISNESTADKSDLRFFHGEDTYFNGSDAGAGFWDAPNTTIGVQRTIINVGLRRMSLQAVTAPFSYTSEYYSTVRSTVENGALTTTIDPSENTDNGYALEWRNAALPVGTTWTISSFEKFADVSAGAVFVTAPVATTCTTGTTCNLIYSVTNTTSASATISLALTPDQTSWTATTATSSIVVAAGSSQQVSVQLAIPTAFADGFIGHLTLLANDGSFTASDSGAINVQNIPNVPVDTTAPVVTYFAIPATATTLTIPINTFAATDVFGITGYLLSESATAPLASDTGWTTMPPSMFTLRTWGYQKLYAYAKDAAGNVSLPLAASIVIGLKDVIDGVVVPAPVDTPVKTEPDLADVLKSLKFAMKIEIPTAIEILHGDVAPLVNGVPQPDGIINLGDTIVILRRVVGL